MPIVNTVLRELVEYALSQKGVRQHYSNAFEKYGSIDLELPGPTWPTVLATDDDSLRCAALDERIKGHRLRYPMVLESGWVPRDGHAFLEIPLDADLPLDFLKSLIDDAYEIIWQKLDDHDRFMIDLSLQPFDEQALLDQLIARSPLAARRDEILALLKPALLLRTSESDEDTIPVGASKLGGQPDLPPDVAWPTYNDGSPLAFLGQLDLGEVAKHLVSLNGLPTSGLLSLFSVWGRFDEDNGVAHLPEGYDHQSGWTVIQHHTDTSSLKRHLTPDRLRSFAAAPIEIIPIRSTPNHRKEPNVAALGYDEEAYDALWELHWNFSALQWGHWLQCSKAEASPHQIGGYAIFQQEFPEELQPGDRVMLLQIGNDSNIQAMWGDGGELTFYVDQAALAEGRFERILGFCQGG